jgi:hypothetical protein
MKGNTVTKVSLIVILAVTAIIIILPFFVSLDDHSYEIIVYIFMAILLVAVAAILIVSLSARKVKVDFDEKGLTVKGPMLDVTVSFLNILSADLRNDVNIGIRAFGYGGIRFAGGRFANEEFGNYMLAIDRKVQTAIVIHHTEGILVFNMSTEDETLMTYNIIRSRAKNIQPVV